jgi:putative NIF3 family GTP cyclohydrolase 1 type 2
VPLADLADRVKAALGVAQVRLVGDPTRPIRRVAVCGGSGGALISLARQRQAEVLVTGDLKHHQALEALGLGLAVLDAGHWATERVSLPSLAKALQDALPGVEIMVSEAEGEPWQYR